MPIFEINTTALDKHVEDKLRAEIKTLKAKLQEWKDAANDHAFIDNPDELESWMSAAIHEDDELYSKYIEPLKLRAEIKNLRAENEKLKMTVSNYHEVQSYLMSESCVPNDTAFEAKVIELKNDNRNKDATIVRLTNENKERKEQYESMEALYDKRDDECDKLKATNINYKSRHEMLVRELKEITEEQNMLYDRLKQSQMSKDQDKNVIKNHTDKHSVYGKTIRNLRVENNSLSTEVSNLKKLVIDLRNSVNSFQSSFNKAEHEIRGLKEKLEKQ